VKKIYEEIRNGIVMPNNKTYFFLEKKKNYAELLYRQK